MKMLRLILASSTKVSGQTVFIKSSLVSTSLPWRTRTQEDLKRLWRQWDRFASTKQSSFFRNLSVSTRSSWLKSKPLVLASHHSASWVGFGVAARLTLKSLSRGGNWVLNRISAGKAEKGPTGLRCVEGAGHRRSTHVMNTPILWSENFLDGPQHVRRRIVSGYHGAVLQVRPDDEGCATVSRSRDPRRPADHPRL